MSKVLVTSAIVAFDNFLRFEDNPSLEKQTLEHCQKNLHPEGEDYMVYIFSNGFRYILLNSAYRASNITDDIVLQKEDSITLTAAKILAQKYNLNARQCITSHDTHSFYDLHNIKNINRKSDLIQKTSELKAEITPESYTSLDKLGARVDNIKDAMNSNLIRINRKFILQPKPQDMITLLSPLLK